MLPVNYSTNYMIRISLINRCWFLLQNYSKLFYKLVTIHHTSYNYQIKQLTKFKRRLSAMKKHKITDYLYEGIIYKNIKAKKLQEKYSDWVSSLSRKERAAFRRYRKKITLKTNINARLRNGEITLDATIISAALKRAQSPDSIIVYRSLAKEETTWLKTFSSGTTIQIPDFKGMHVREEIKSTYPISNSAAYIFVLIPKGANVAYINNLTLFYRHEKELLIDKDQRFEIIDIQQILGKSVFIMKLITETQTNRGLSSVPHLS